MEDSEAAFFVGFDVGSSSVHYVVLCEDKKLVYSPAPILHFADPIGAAAIGFIPFGQGIPHALRFDQRPDSSDESEGGDHASWPDQSRCGDRP